jgi:LL-diaminopimelate aminotransferase
MNKNLDKLPPYLFVEIDKKKQSLLAAGKHVIDFGIGDPDLLPPEEVYTWLIEFSRKEPSAHRYPSNKGDIRFRNSVSRFYQKRFAVEVSPESEVTSLIGSKEGLAHTILAYVNPGDYVLVPDPAYPVYENMTVLAGGIPYKMPLKMENDFFPDLDSIPVDILKKTKLMFLCYPNNPTNRIAKKEDLAKAVRLASKYDFVIAYDNAYSEIYYAEKPLSIFNIEGAWEVAIEFNSFSKMFNFTGWRIAFAIAREALLFPLLRIKQNVDSGQYLPIQLVAAKLLDEKLDFTEKMREIYKKRLSILIDGLRKAGLKVEMPPATFYLWVGVPDGYTSMEWSTYLLENLSIVSTPGVGFGKYGEGYIRISYANSMENLKKAVGRIKNAVSSL